MRTIKAHVTKQGGPKLDDNYKFEAKSNEPISIEEAHKVQRKLGYDPRGYDLVKFKCTPYLFNLWVATWECQGGCE